MTYNCFKPWNPAKLAFMNTCCEYSLKLPLNIIIIIIIGFAINVQVQGQHPHRWGPLPGSRLAARMVPGMSIMRIDGRELPLSAIPLCQLLPCHLGPPRPTLSISLCFKGCLNYIIGDFHMSVPMEPSLLQNEVQSLNAQPSK